MALWSAAARRRFLSLIVSIYEPPKSGRRGRCRPRPPTPPDVLSGIRRFHSRCVQPRMPAWTRLTSRCVSNHWLFMARCVTTGLLARRHPAFPRLRRVPRHSAATRRFGSGSPRWSWSPCTASDARTEVSAESNRPDLPGDPCTPRGGNRSPSRSGRELSSPIIADKPIPLGCASREPPGCDPASRSRLFGAMPSVPPLRRRWPRNLRSSTNATSLFLPIDAQTQRLFQEPSHRREHAARPPPSTARRCCSHPHSGRSDGHASFQLLAPSHPEADSPTTAKVVRLAASLRVRAMQTPSCISPASRKRRTIRSRRLSAIRRASRDIKMSWFTRSKNFSRSTSTTIPRPSATYSFAFRKSVVRSASGTEASGSSPKKVGSSKVFQHLQNRLLHQTVDYRRDAQLTHPGVWPARLRGICTPRTGLRLVRPVQKRRRQFLSMRGEPGFEFVDGHPETASPAAPLFAFTRRWARCEFMPSQILSIKNAVAVTTVVGAEVETGGQGSCWDGRRGCLRLHLERFRLRFRRRRSRRGAPLRPPRGVGIGRVPALLSLRIHRVVSDWLSLATKIRPFAALARYGGPPRRALPGLVGAIVGRANYYGLG